MNGTIMLFGGIAIALIGAVLLVLQIFQNRKSKKSKNILSKTLGSAQLMVASACENNKQEKLIETNNEKSLHMKRLERIVEEGDEMTIKLEAQGIKSEQYDETLKLNPDKFTAVETESEVTIKL